MSISEIISYLKTIEYPYEKLPLEEICYMTLKNCEGVQFIDDKNYIYLSNYKCPKKHLGLYILNRHAMNTCHSLSSYYTIQERIHSRRFDGISPYQYWNENKDIVIEKCLIQLKKYDYTHIKEELPYEFGGVNSTVNHMGLQHECALALFRTGMPASFPSNLVVKVINDHYKTYKAKILDISAGWGDRLLASCILDSYYLACDPNSKLSIPYNKIIEKYGHKNKQFVICSPFEDIDVTEVIKEHGKFNCLFSSPPFFDLEIYSTESTQSSERYKTIDIWIEKFLFASLLKCNDLLEKDAYIFLHLSDINVKGDHKDHKDHKGDHKDHKGDHKINYVEKTIKYAETLNWEFIGNYGFAVKDKEDKESETYETRQQKNKHLLKPTHFIKKYSNGIRCNDKGSILTQTLWVFKKL